MNTNDLQELAWAAEDDGRQVDVIKFPDTDVIVRVEVDGEVTTNDDWMDELNDHDQREIDSLRFQ